MCGRTETGRVALLLVIALVCTSNLSARGESSSGLSGPLRVYLFASSTCPECRAIKERLLPRLRERYGSAIATQHIPVDDADHFRLQLLYEKHFGVTDNDALKAFVGSVCLSGEQAIWARLEATVADQLAIGARTPTPDEIRADTREKASEVETTSALAAGRFQQFKLAGIAIAGLIDGINPCAFTTLVFFISLLASMGHKGRSILVVGACFGLGMFLTYLALGIGGLKAIKILSVSSGVSTGLSCAVGAMALILGGLSLWEFIRYRRTKNPDVIGLKLPGRLRARVRGIIARQMHTRRLAASLSLGVIVALLESVCTGQVYLPILLCVARDPELRLKATSCLVLYNVMFISPLVLVFALAYCGATSRWLADLNQRHLGWSKLLLGLLFVGLGVTLLGQTI